MKQKRKKIEFQKLVNRHGGYIEDAKLDVLQWMFKTGHPYRQKMGGGNSTQGVFELLHNESYYCWSPTYREHGFKSYDYLQSGLKLAFVRAIVADDVLDCVKQWRKDQRIGLGSYRMLMLPEPEPSYCPRYSPEYGQDSVYSLFKCAERTLTTQLNPCHADAVIIDYILLSPSPMGWTAILNYGVDGSIWTENLCKPTGFRAMVRAARLRIDKLTK